MGALADLERRAGRSVDVVLWYQHWSGWGEEAEPAWIESVAATGRTPVITWEPWHAPSAPGDPVAEQPAYALNRIAGGTFDAYVRRFARALRDTGRPVVLRPMHEMNGDWYPWGGTVNGGSPADYIAAWRHLHGLFAAEGATNVRWMWSPSAADVPSVPANAFERYYPGAAYVDVLALDGYNWGAAFPQYGGWTSFAGIFADAYRRITALGPQPVWIAETAAAPEGGDNVAWARDMFAAATSMPRVEGIVWFDVDKERDWRLPPL